MSEGPIVVTGSHRSGSSWVGRLLTLDRQAHYIHEPLNPGVLPSWFGAPAEHTWEYLPAGDPRWSRIDGIVSLRFPARAAFADSRRRHGTVETSKRIIRTAQRAAVARRRGARALLKDPFMLFNSDEFIRRYDGRVVYTVRNPAAFVSSLLRLDWRFDFKNWAEQPLLLEEHLAPWAEEIKDAAAHPPPMFEHACLAWRVIHGYMAMNYSASSHGKALVRHDQLSKHVGEELPRLYSALGLTYSAEVEAGIRALTTGGTADVTRREVNLLQRDSVTTADAWRQRLSDQQIADAFRLTQPEARHFYPSGPSQS